MPGQIGEDQIASEGHRGRDYGKAVQAVGQVDRIGCPHDDECRKRYVGPAQIRRSVFEKRHVEPGVKSGSRHR